MAHRSKFPNHAPRNPTKYYTFFCEGNKWCYLECRHLRNCPEGGYKCDAGLANTKYTPGSRRGHLTKKEQLRRGLIAYFRDREAFQASEVVRLMNEYYPMFRFTTNYVIRVAIPNKWIQAIPQGLIYKNGKTVNQYRVIAHE